jgi:hypothetical protein
MIRRMPTNKRVASAVGPVLALLAAPLTALAQRADDREVVYGRLEGFSRDVTLQGGSTALTWILLIFLGAVCLSVMFKNARRTHLD